MGIFQISQKGNWQNSQEGNEHPLPSLIKYSFTLSLREIWSGRTDADSFPRPFFALSRLHALDCVPEICHFFHLPKSCFHRFQATFPEQIFLKPSETTLFSKIKRLCKRISLFLDERASKCICDDRCFGINNWSKVGVMSHYCDITPDELKNQTQDSILRKAILILWFDLSHSETMGTVSVHWVADPSNPALFCSSSILKPFWKENSGKFLHGS